MWLYFAFVAVAITVGGRLLDVQVRQSQSLAALAAAQDHSSVVLPGSRGRILDRTGHVLVSNQPVYDVWADPGLIPQSSRHDVAAKLAPILQLGPGKLEDLLGTPTRFVYLIKGVQQEVRNRLVALNISGIVVSPQQQRVYSSSPLPKTSFASQLLGYVDADGHGQNGLESYYDSVLRGSDGKESTVRDLAGNAIVLGRQTQVDAQNGKDLTLGLDSGVQYWAEQALAKGVDDAQAESGQIMVMDTHSGAIRAWADYPSYDANNYAKASIGLFRDTAVADLYEPGSVLKVVTYAGGLDHRAITPATPFNEGPTSVDGYTIQDWDHKAHGNITMQTAFDMSLNNGAMRVGQLEGKDAFYANLLNFGIGAPTGIDVAGEVNQPLRAQSQWSDVNYATASFGQGVAVTPVQMLAAVNAVGNGGVWVQPHVVESVVDPGTGKSTPFKPTTRRVISPEAAATLGQMMTGVVEDKGGEGFMARIPGFSHHVSGKTGTADEPTNGQYQGDLVVSFGGFLPTENPQFTMLVILRHPHETKVQRFGAFLAAPIWKDMAQIMIDQWRITP